MAAPMPLLAPVMSIVLSMPRVLFIAHGMGDHPPGWESSVTALLDQLLARYPKFAGEPHPFTTRVIVEPLTYDAIFDKYVLAWGQERAALAEFSQSNQIPLSGVLGLLGSGQLPGNVTSAFWETFLDPILYRGTLVSAEVQRSVSDQLRKRWGHHLAVASASGSTEPVEVSVLAHSLGTIVMSDVLAIVGENRDGLAPAFSSHNICVKTFMTLANVSRLGPARLHRIDSYKTVVRPVGTADANNHPPFVERFINARHPWDPFCMWQRFAPTGWGDLLEQITDLNHLHEAVPHGFRHYLSHPSVHIPLFRALLGAKAIGKADATKALEQFEPLPFSSTCLQTVKTLRDELKRFAQMPTDSEISLDDFVRRALELYQLAERAKGSCLELPTGFV